VRFFVYISALLPLCPSFVSCAHPVRLSLVDLFLYMSSVIHSTTLIICIHGDWFLLINHLLACIGDRANSWINLV
jgi:hypothetical protein